LIRQPIPCRGNLQHGVPAPASVIDSATFGSPELALDTGLRARQGFRSLLTLPSFRHDQGAQNVPWLIFLTVD